MLIYEIADWLPPGFWGLISFLHWVTKTSFMLYWCGFGIYNRSLCRIVSFLVNTVPTLAVTGKRHEGSSVSPFTLNGRTINSMGCLAFPEWVLLCLCLVATGKRIWVPRFLVCDAHCIQVFRQVPWFGLPARTRLPAACSLAGVCLSEGISS